MVHEGTAVVAAAVHRSLGSVEPRDWCSMAGWLVAHSIRMDLCCWDHMVVAVAVAVVAAAVAAAAVV